MIAVAAGAREFSIVLKACQDNGIAWLDWNDLARNRDIFEVFKFMIAFRNSHVIIRRNQSKSTYAIPKVSTHGYTAWMNEYSWESKQVGVMYAGRVMGRDDVVYACFNAYWEEIEITLPDIPGRGSWLCVLDTCADPVIKKRRVNGPKYKMGPRSAIVLEFG